MYTGFFLASSPCARAVGDEESKEASDKQAFHNLFCRNTFHQAAFGEVEKEESNESTHENGSKSGLKTGRS